MRPMILLWLMHTVIMASIGAIVICAVNDTVVVAVTLCAILVGAGSTLYLTILDYKTEMRRDCDVL